MQGDLGQPPIIIRKSRAKSLQMVVVSAAFALALLWGWRGHQAGPATWMMAPALVMFALGVPLFAWQAIRPEQLTLSPGGLEWRSLRATLTFSWDQLSEFSVISISGAKLIGFNVTGSPPKRLARFNTAMTGASAALPGLWEIKPEALADILNAARSKWRLART